MRQSLAVLTLILGTLPARGPVLAQETGAPDPAQTHCYAGTSRAQMPDGTVVMESPTWLWRSLDPVTSQITERVIMREGPDQPPEVHEVVLHVDGNRFTAEWEGMTTEGELIGEAWAWSSWHSDTTAPEGMRISSLDNLTETGVHAVKTIYGPAGEVVIVMDETLEEMPCLEWEQAVPTPEAPPTP